MRCDGGLSGAALGRGRLKGPVGPVDPAPLTKDAGKDWS